MEKYKHEKELIDRRNLKDSADDFIQNPQDRVLTENPKNISDQSEYLKKQFLKRKKNLSSFLPEKKVNSKSHFTKLGSFKIKIGEVSVGYEKFKKNSNLRFTLISDDEEDFDDKGSKISFKDNRNYFKKPCDSKRDRKYEENNTTLEWNPRENSFKRVNEIFSDDIVEDKDEILYDDEIENKEISKLRKNSKSLNPVSLDNAISDMNDIKNHKKEDNKIFALKLREFSNMYRKNKIKKFEDPDQLKVALERISSENLDFILQKRMKEKLQDKLYEIIRAILKKRMKGVE